jgi:hypothetical protein
MVRQFNDQFDNISREIFALKEQIGELNVKYCDHNQIKRQLELEINEMETEEAHLNKKFEILKDLYSEPDPKPSQPKSPTTANFFYSDKYSVSSPGKYNEKKSEMVPDSLDMEAGVSWGKQDRLPKAVHVKMPDKSWKTNTIHDPIFNRKVDLEDMQCLYDEMMTLKTELDEAAIANSNLHSQLEGHFKGHFGIKSCSACKKRYTPLNADPRACQYHPGQLTYYYCKGCGADEYYSCCNRCLKCTPGCRSGKHAPAK